MAAPETILVVDDAPAGRYAKAHALRGAGYATAEAESGAQALDLSTRNPPDLVLLDVKLPDMSGRTVCERIKQNRPETIVIHTSAIFIDPKDRVEGLENGADGYIVEPVAPRELVANVSALLRLRRSEAAANRAHRQIGLLGAEAAHRAKNTFALIQAILRTTHAETVAEYMKAVQRRIASLERADSLLSENQWSKADLLALIQSEIAPFQMGDPPRIETIGPGLFVSAKTTRSIAMIIHELAANAVKYGALSVTTGRIEIKWAVDADGGLRIVWTESGGPPVSEPSRHGFGTSMIDRVVTGQHGGTVDFAWQTEGLVCTIRLPRKALAL